MPTAKSTKGDKDMPKQFNPLPLYLIAGILVAGLVAIAIVDIIKKKKKSSKEEKKK